MKSVKDRIIELQNVIGELQTQGKRTDYLEEQLRDLRHKFPQGQGINLFEEKPLEPEIITQRELNQMHTFGFVVDGNPMANKQALKATQAYKFARKIGVYLGF